MTSAPQPYDQDADFAVCPATLPSPFLGWLEAIDDLVPTWPRWAEPNDFGAYLHAVLAERLRAGYANSVAEFREWSDVNPGVPWPPMGRPGPLRRAARRARRFLHLS